MLNYDIDGQTTLRDTEKEVNRQRRKLTDREGS